MSTKQIKQSVLDAVRAKGLDQNSADADLKKAYFAASSTPANAATLAALKEALAGNTTAASETETAAPATEAKAEKPAKEKKVKAEKAPAAPKEPKPVKEKETAEAALARLKADPKTAERWARVQSVDEMGNKGPTKITIVCDDKGPNGETLTRQIKVQDLFQVRFSVEGSKGAAKAARAAKAKAKRKAAAEAKAQAEPAAA